MVLLEMTGSTPSRATGSFAWVKAWGRRGERRRRARKVRMSDRAGSCESAGAAASGGGTSWRAAVRWQLVLVAGRQRVAYTAGAVMGRCGAAMGGARLGKPRARAAEV